MVRYYGIERLAIVGGNIGHPRSLICQYQFNKIIDDPCCSGDNGSNKVNYYRHHLPSSQ